MLLKFLAIFILLSQFGDAALKLGLKRHETEGYKLFKQGRFYEYRALRAQQQRQKSRAGRFDSGKTGIDHTPPDFSYITQVSFGNPPQTFNLVPDISTASTWVLDASADDGRKAKDKLCVEKPCFDSNSSSTYIKDGRKFEDDGTPAVGFLGIDTINLGELAVSNVTFGQVSTPPNWFILNYRYIDGYLGLAFKSNLWNGVESVFAAAVRQHLVDKPVFTIWLQNSSPYKESQGQITWGDFDSEHCSPDITYFPLIHTNSFEFKLDGYSLNDGKKVDSNWKAISVLSPVSSDNIAVYIPYQAFQDIVAAVNTSWDYSYGIYPVDCDVKFNWTVYAGDKKLVIDENVGVSSFDNNDGSKTCFLGFEGWVDWEWDVLLGIPFLHEWCSVYDISTGQIGYSRSIGNRVPI